jgi:lipopolysaccharide transport system permease protein
VPQEGSAGVVLTSKSQSSALQHHPEVVIRARSEHTLAHDVAGIWNNREIAWTLAVREIQIRYKQSVLGIAWAVLQPVLTTAIFTFVFSYLARIPTGEVPYSVFVFSGLLMWQYFSRVVVDGASSLVKNEAIITKVFFPRLLLPLVPSLSASIDFLIALVVLVAMMLLYGMVPSPLIVLVPLVLLAAGLLGYGIGLVLSPLNAIYRDVGFALPFFVQIGMYLTPVIYPIAFVPPRYQWLYALNPAATLLDTMRAIIVGATWPGLASYSILLLWTVGLLGLGLAIFRKLEPAIVDQI